MTKTEKIIACNNNVNLNSTARMCGTTLSYVTTVRNRIGLTDIKDTFINRNNK